jgi:peptide/nickel transport system substrate-binding protein
VPGANWRSEMNKKSMPLMVNFFSGWLDYPEYFFFWCYSRPERDLQHHELQVAGHGQADRRRARGRRDRRQDKYDKDVEGFIDQGLRRHPAHSAVPAVSQRRDAEEHLGLSYWFHRQLDYRSIVKG